MKEGILVTAIGSLSSQEVIASLEKLSNYNIYGCDIYPAAWHAESLRYKNVFRVPMAADADRYISKVLELCVTHGIGYIIPLTDVEVDVFKQYRHNFVDRGLVLCMQDDAALLVARDKHRLSKQLQDSLLFKTMPTYRNKAEIPEEHSFPYVAKPYNGRSSEGLLYVNDMEMLEYVSSKENYIIQPFINGDIFAVDYIRNRRTGNDYAFIRKELLRTSNGAGITVQLVHDETLKAAASLIGKELDINGCINLEFIKADNTNYLIDINPRFSAGIAFTAIMGYDIVKNHFYCFIGNEIEEPASFQDVIITRSYSETIMPDIKEQIP